MQAFTRLTSTVLPLARRDVDTDQIIPASYLKVTTKEGLGEGLFSHWRRDPAFVLNDPRYNGAQILLAGENFGCGSSREHAPWALLAHGFRVVLSTRLADIFRNNSLKNGLLAVEIEAPLWQTLLVLVEGNAQAPIAVDLEAQSIQLPDGSRGQFTIDSFSRRCLMAGVDALGYLLDRLPEIERWQSAHPPSIDTRNHVHRTESPS